MADLPSPLGANGSAQQLPRILHVTSQMMARRSCSSCFYLGGLLVEILRIGKKKKMKCFDYKKTFPENVNKAAFYSARVKGGDINVCEAEIPPNRLRRYKLYHDGVITRKVARERSKAVNEFLI